MKAGDWDRLASVYDAEVCDIFVRDRRRVISRWLRQRGLLGGGRTMLDIGCGIGSFFQQYGRRLGDKIGVDHSPRMLRMAAIRCRRLRNCTWMRADVQALPATLRGCGDLVVCSNVLTFVSAAASLHALRQVARCARSGGWVLLILPSLESHDAVVALEAGRPPPRRRDTAIVRRDDRRQRFYTRNGAIHLATRAGLQSVQARKVWYPWIDEGISRAPRDHELPWDWLVTGRK